MTADDDFVTNKLQISCSDAVELVTNYIDAELGQHDLSVFETHLENCEGCTVFVDQIKMTIRLMRAANRAEVEILPSNFDDLVAMLQDRATTEG